MTEQELRKRTKETYPHVKIQIRMMSFFDLARDSKKCLTIKGARSCEEIETINTWAKEAGVLKDGSLRIF